MHQIGARCSFGGARAPICPRTTGCSVGCEWAQANRGGRERSPARSCCRGRVRLNGGLCGQHSVTAESGCESFDSGPLRCVRGVVGLPRLERGALLPRPAQPGYIPAQLMGDGRLDPRFIDDLARRLSAAVPPGVTALRRDLEDNFKAVLQAGLARLDLVSRQEFDVQAAVLRRTREKLEALEARVAALEQEAGAASVASAARE